MDTPSAQQYAIDLMGLPVERANFDADRASLLPPSAHSELEPRTEIGENLPAMLPPDTGRAMRAIRLLGFAEERGIDRRALLQRGVRLLIGRSIPSVSANATAASISVNSAMGTGARLPSSLRDRYSFVSTSCSSMSIQSL